MRTEVVAISEIGVRVHLFGRGYLLGFEQNLAMVRMLHNNMLNHY